MTARILLVAVLGLALATYILTSVDLDAVFTAVSNMGWRGFALVCLYALGVFIPMGLAWYVLLPDNPLRKAKLFIWSRMVRDAAAEVLPFSQVGGIALGARAAMLHGLPGSTAIGSMIVDVTTELIAQIAYLILGVAILSARLAETSHVHARSLTNVMVVGVILISIGGALFVALQRYGHHWIARQLAPRVFPGSVAATTAVAEVLDEIYRSRVRIGLSLLLHFLSWVLTAVGTWIAFRLMGAEVELAPVIAIEALVYATRSAGFVIPNALGIQEAAYKLLAPLFGITPEVGVALSVIKRARDLVLGIPILILWQLMEGQRALAGKPSRDH